MIKNIKQHFGLLGCSVLMLTTTLPTSAQSPTGKFNTDILPTPMHYVVRQGTGFRLNERTQILFPKGDKAMERNARFLADFIGKSIGKRLKVRSGTKGTNAIVLSLGLLHKKTEAYRISTSSEGISIQGVSPAGVFYGIQTLRKSLPYSVTEVQIPPLTIEDHPFFDYRGAMLDVGRHIYSVQEVKTFIDMMALHNMNRLHWHLTEDQGWRLQIKKYPKLTQVGGWRKETMEGKNFNKFDGKPYGGFYTQTQVKEILNYAAERNIVVIPEIDLPGHMQAALAAYPHLGCTGGPYQVRTQWGISDEVLCAGDDQTLRFLEDVLQEVIDLFPSEYIHIGGDECPKKRWKECAKCQKRITDMGLTADAKHSKEERLQSFVIRHVAKFLNERGRKLIGWDEILEGGLPPKATVMSWRGEGGGIEAAKQGHDVIMTPNTYLYLDYYQSQHRDSEPLAIGGYLPLHRVYSYKPLPSALTPEQQKHIIGIQGNLWTEYIPTFAQAQYMVLPRWAAIAELQWNNPSEKNFKAFAGKLRHLLSVYKQEGYNFAKHILEVQAGYTPQIGTGNINVQLSTIDNAPIHYTMDGSQPSASSPQVSGTLNINRSAHLRAIAIRQGENGKEMSEQLNINKATARTITAVNAPVPNYSYAGVTTLVDGIRGGNSYASGRWIAFRHTDMDITIDLGQTTEISTAGFNACVVKGDWVLDAAKVSIEVSTDGTHFTQVAQSSTPKITANDPDGIAEHRYTFAPATARYVRIKATPETMVNGKPLGGYLFVDEIIVE